jgi:hypothetical protein
MNLTVSLVVIILTVSVGFTATQNPSSDIDDFLRKLGVAKSKESALAEDLNDGADDEDDGDDTLAKVMTDALLGSAMEEGEDGDGSIMGKIMSGSEEEASAQFRFFRRIFRRVRRFARSRTGRRIGRFIKRRVCG